MKTGILSIITAITGILFVIWFNYQTSELFITELTRMQSGSDLSPAVVTSGKLNKLIASGIGLLGLLIGIKSVRNGNRIELIGIIFSVILIILTFVPIWQFLLSDSTLNINFES